MTTKKIKKIGHRVLYKCICIFDWDEHPVKAMGDFLGEEALLFRAIFRAPEKGWPILSRISNIFSKQVSVGVAAYKLGQSSIQSLKAVGHFFTSLAGIS